MNFVPLILAVFLSGAGFSHAAVDEAFQREIDVSVSEIMLTKVGQSICQKILSKDSEAIAFHLGVSRQAAEAIAANCGESDGTSWISETSAAEIRKATLNPTKARKYNLLSAETVFPIESWTDPFTNTTVLMAGREGITHERLVQLLAHEMAVYFDSKANPAHADAQNVPELKNLTFTTSSNYSPLVAATDPLIAHSLTFIRALQVEYAIVDELIANGKILPPTDHNDAYLRLLVSDRCKEECLEKFVARMRLEYLPIGLPLLAFAPHFRSIAGREIARARVRWNETQMLRTQDSLNNYPLRFLRTQFTGHPLADLQRVFVTSTPPKEFQTVVHFLNDDLWPIEVPALISTRVQSGETFLEYMKRPLLSGSNILLSSGPRVRVKPGITE